MYGIINNTIKDYITTCYGSDLWMKIKLKSGIVDDFFLSSQEYDDEITDKIIFAANEKLNISKNDLMLAIGEFWILKLSEDNLEAMLKSTGDTFDEYLTNLPNFHSRMMLMYKDTVPTEIKVIKVSEKEYNLQYFSQRMGYSYFLLGVYIGISKIYQVDVEIVPITLKDNGGDRDEFLIRIKNV